jgi:hypothetical protein
MMKTKTNGSFELLPLLPKNEPDEAHSELKAWSLVELFGHQRIVGWVTVDPIDFPGMVRVDVPDLLKDGKIERPGFTRYFGRSALYSVTPISEQSVRELLPHVNGHPARPVELGSASDW